MVRLIKSFHILLCFIIITTIACNKPKYQNKRIDGVWYVDHGGDCNVDNYKSGEFIFKFISTTEIGGRVESTYKGGATIIGYYEIVDATHMVIECGLIDGKFETSSIHKNKFSISGKCPINDRSIMLAFRKQ